MQTAELITVIFVFALAIISFIVSLFNFFEKGYLFNNAYIYASEKERKTMDKKPYYRQSAIVFCLVGVIFIIIGLSTLLANSKILFAEIPVIAITLCYAIISSVKNTNK